MGYSFFIAKVYRLKACVIIGFKSFYYGRLGRSKKAEAVARCLDIGFANANGPSKLRNGSVLYLLYIWPVSLGRNVDCLQILIEASK